METGLATLWRVTHLWTLPTLTRHVMSVDISSFPELIQFQNYNYTTRPKQPS